MGWHCNPYVPFKKSQKNILYVYKQMSTKTMWAITINIMGLGEFTGWTRTLDEVSCPNILSSRTVRFQTMLECILLHLDRVVWGNSSNQIFYHLCLLLPHLPFLCNHLCIPGAGKSFMIDYYSQWNSIQNCLIFRSVYIKLQHSQT